MFEWELDLLNNLRQVLAAVQLIGSSEDRILWKFEKNGVFSVKSRVQVIENEGAVNQAVSSYNFTSAVWKDLVPPRIELLTWFVLIGRVNTKDRMARMNLLQQDQILSPLCSKHDESLSHFFFTCEFPWRIWCFWLKQWNISWVSPCDQRIFIESWFAMRMSGQRRKLWAIVFLVVIWTVWKSRNNVIFDKKESVNLVGTIEIGKYLYDQWARCVISKIQPKIGDIHPKSRGEVNN